MKAFKLAVACATVVVAGVAGVAAVIGLATPAQAGWRFTQWGMTAGEVVAASNGKVGPRDPKVVAQELAKAARFAPEGAAPSDGCTHKMLEPLIVDRLVYDDVRFCFSMGRLTSVGLYSKANPHVVANALEEALGPAVEAHPDRDMPLWRFVDREKKDRLILTTRPPFDGSDHGSMIFYEPTASGF